MNVLNKSRWLLTAALLIAGCTGPAEKKGQLDEKLRKEATDQLWLNLRTQSKLEKVHVAEFIWWLELDTASSIYNIFIEEEKLHNTESPYRIPVWRVLARTEKDTAKKRMWIEKLLSVYSDSAAPDRLHSVESLSKLGVSPMQAYPGMTRQILEGGQSPLFSLTFWAVSTAITQPDSIRANRRMLINLQHTGATGRVRAYASYSLRHLGNLTGDEWHQLAENVLAYPLEDDLQVYALSAGVVTAPADSLSSPLYASVRSALLKNALSPRKDDRMELGAALAKRGTLQDVDMLVALMRTTHPLPDSTGANLTNGPAEADIRSVAAYALLSIDKAYRQP